MAQDIYQKIKTHLHESLSNFIDVMNLETEKFITRKLSINQIKSEYGSLDNYFQSLVKKGVEQVQVTLRKKRGTSSVPIGAGLNIGIGNSTKVMAPPPVLPEAPKVSSPIDTTLSPSVTTEILKFKYELLKDRLKEIKTALSEEKNKRKKQTKKIESYEVKIRELKNTVHLYDREKALEIKELENSKKGFLESPTGEKVLEAGLSIAANLAELNSKSPPGLASASVNENISDVKKALIMFIENDSVSDEDCTSVYYALVGLVQKNEVFTKKLIQLLKTHELENQDG